MASAPQPASQKTQVSPSNFGGSVVDGNRIAMVGVGSWFQTQDATPGGTNLISPISVATGTVTPLVVPTNATSVRISPKTNNVQVSEQSGTTSLAQYYEVPAGSSVVFEVARMKTIYLLGVTGASVVSFIFTTV